MLAGIGIGTIAFITLLVYVLAPKGRPVAAKDTATLFSLVQDGDIICRLGDRFWSHFFKDISEDDKRFSHMGIVRINEDRITVIHSEGDTGHGRDYVHEVPLEEFVKIARAIGVYRIYNMDGSTISDSAVNFIGIPFDWQFDMHDSSRIYCTELLHVILQRIRPELELQTIYVKELQKDIIPLDAISNSPFFEEIYYTGTY
ncbi:MAG: hypothetical protein FWG89_04835 [Treponema sp.]|nr:hypothetical protein [Treponema sp.]